MANFCSLDTIQLGCGEVYLRLFLITAQNGGKWLFTKSGCFMARKLLPFQLNMRHDGLQRLSGGFGEEKNPFPPQEFQLHIVQLVAWLLY
jgi:hypothetical protein